MCVHQRTPKMIIIVTLSRLLLATIDPYFFLFISYRLLLTNGLPKLDSIIIVGQLGSKEDAE